MRWRVGVDNVYTFEKKSPKSELFSTGYPDDGMNHLAWVFAALYVSEGWYDSWKMRGKIHHKARAIVIYDRTLNKAMR